MRQSLKLVTPKEVASETDTNLSLKKTPGYDLITGQIMKELPAKGITKLTHLISAGSVSYTHLDVYKRQVVQWLWASSGDIKAP